MFFALLGCALQVAAATPSPLSVLFGDRKRVVPVVVRPDGARAVRADLLADAIGGAFVADGGIRYHLQIAATRVDLEAGSASVAVGTETYLISSPVYRQSGRVFVSLTFATDLLPRLTNGLLYDHGKRELRRFGSVTARSTAVPAAVASTARDKQPSRADDAPAKRQRVVVVDAGHGGVDRGMTGPLGASHRVFEKDITLAVARELRGALERRGIAVVMTRATDTLIALGDRGKIANQAKGDLFISIHVNAANPGWQQPSGARGYETYFLAEAKTEDERRVEAMENEVIKFETTADATRDESNASHRRKCEDTLTLIAAFADASSASFLTMT